MKHYLLTSLLVLTSCASASSQAVVAPKEQDQMRTERNSTAYKKALMQATKDPESALCYYKHKGCEAQVLNANNNEQSWSEERPKLAYPRQGYVLDDDGYYKFKPLALSRH